MTFILASIPIFLTLGLSIFLFFENKALKNNLDDLVQKIEKFPEPISQGRLGLMIKKENDQLKEEFFEKDGRLEFKLLELEKSIQSLPRPISEGRIGLIINKSLDQFESEFRLNIQKTFPEPVSEGRIGLIFDKKIKDVTEKLGNSLPQPLSEGKVGLIFDKKMKNAQKELEKVLEKKIGESKQDRNLGFKEGKGFEALLFKVESLESSYLELSKEIRELDYPQSLSEEISSLRNLVEQNSSNRSPTLPILSENNSDISNVESLNNLIKTYPDFAYKAIKEDMRSNRKGGFLNSIKGAFNLIFVKRSLTPQKGNSVDSILSRAERDLKTGDYDSALNEMDQLPIEASKVMKIWREKFEYFLDQKS